MSNTQKLRAIIKRAMKNGYKFPSIELREWDIGVPTPPHKFVIGIYGYIQKGLDYASLDHEDLQLEEVLLSHNFAKAYFGEKQLRKLQPDWSETQTEEAWKSHLRQAVLETDLISYYYQFI